MSILNPCEKLRNDTQYGKMHLDDDTYWTYDAQGIELAKVCRRCEKAVRSRYRTEILTGYTQADVDEPIEPDDY